MAASFTRIVPGAYRSTNLVPVEIHKSGSGRTPWIVTVIGEAKMSNGSVRPFGYEVARFATLADAKTYALPLIRHPQGCAAAEGFASMAARKLEGFGGHGRAKQHNERMASYLAAWRTFTTATGAKVQSFGEAVADAVTATYTLMPARAGGDGWPYFVEDPRDELEDAARELGIELDPSASNTFALALIDAKEEDDADKLAAGVRIVTAQGRTGVVVGRGASSAKHGETRRCRMDDGKVYDISVSALTPDENAARCPKCGMLKHAPDSWCNTDDGEPALVPAPTAANLEHVSGAVVVGTFVVGADQVVIVAQWARDFARDCEWSDVDALDIAAMSDAAVIRAAAKHYDGGIAALTADALMDAQLQARADDDARARGYTGCVATPGAQRERLEAAKAGHLADEAAIATLPTSGHGAAHLERRWCVRAFYADGTSALIPRMGIKREAREDARGLLWWSTHGPEAVAVVVVDGYEELEPVRDDVTTRPTCRNFAAADAVGSFLRAMGTREPAKPYAVHRLHSGTEDGPLWYVVRVSDGVRVSGGWMHEEDARVDCEALLDGTGRVVAWAVCKTCQRGIDVTSDEASSYECGDHGPMERGYDVEPVADVMTAKQEDADEARRLVVVDVENYRLGWIIGDYVRTEEDAVFYDYAEGECEGMAPADCVRVMRDDEARATGVAPLVTRGQLETADKLADAAEVLNRVPVRVDVVPDVSDDAGAVLVLVTPDADGPADPVQWVWASNGASRYPCHAHYDYATAADHIAADGHRPVVQREGTSVFRVLPGGSYDRRRF